jgi:hypothetical protein
MAGAPPPYDRAVQDDFSKLTEVAHSFSWLSEEPVDVIKGAIEDCLAAQVPGAALGWLQITEEPAVLTGGPRDPANPEQIVVRRAGVAVPFLLAVLSGRGVDELAGIFTWVAIGLDTPEKRHDRIWLDLGAELDWAREELKERIYDLARPARPNA